MRHWSGSLEFQVVSAVTDSEKITKIFETDHVMIRDRNRIFGKWEG